MSQIIPADRSNITALIPAYYEERYLRDVVRRVREQLDCVLVVDDGSTDGTSQEAEAGGAEVIRHEANRGKGAALKTGLAELGRRSGVEYAMLLDGDGQHAPEEIPRFIEAANRTGAGYIIGNRMCEAEKMPFVRKMTNRWMSWQISRLCEQAIPDTQCGFRLIRKDLFAPIVAAQSNNYDFETEMLALVSRLGQKIESAPVSTIYGDEKSKIHPVRDTIRFFQLLDRLGKGGRKGAKQADLAAVE